MGTAGASSSIACQSAPLWSRQIQLLHRHRSQNFLAWNQKLPMKLDTLPMLSYSVKHKMPTMRRKKFSFAAIESRSFNSKGLLGLGSFRTGVIRAGNEDEDHEVDKVEIKPFVSWTSSIQRGIMVSRIFMAVLVWICLFFGISVVDSEIGGGRPGGRRPRK